jgi:two-component system sensor histidine kinase KdpD
MALLLSADVLDAGLQRYLHAHGIEPLWGTSERILICLTPRTHAEHIVASARRNANRFHCEVLGVYVKQHGLSERDQTAMQHALAVARAAGISVNVLEGEDVVERIVEFARTHGVTQIFVGHGLKARWRTPLFGSAINRLIRLAHGMDVRVFPH